MKAIVLGAAGAMASVVIRDLLEFAGDIQLTAADARPIQHSDARVRSALLDVRDEPGTARLMEGHDVAINCVTYYLNVPVMRSALAARVPYVDLGGLYHGSIKQFELHDAFTRAGLSALL